MENKKGMRVVLRLLTGLGEEFLPGVASIVLVVLCDVLPRVFWLELGFILVVLLTFPIYNIARRKWLVLAGNAVGVLLLAPTYWVIVCLVIAGSASMRV